MDIKEKLVKEIEETKILFSCVPALPVALYITAVVCMNLMANKTILYLDWIGTDGGIFLSWIPFLCMDVLTSHFGPKASVKISLLALVSNLVLSLVFKIVAIIPTVEDFSSFNAIFNSTWFIVLGSSIAFVISSLVNCFSNYAIGRLFRKNPNGKLAFATKSYISTFLGQFLDNFTFCFIVFTVFAPIYWGGFSWTVVQCVVSGLVQALLELVCEAIFSPYGYRICKKWRENKVGEAYLSMRKA